MTPAENYFKTEFKSLLVNYQECFEQDSIHGKEKAVDFRCPDCPFSSHEEDVMRKHIRKLHKKRFEEEQYQRNDLKCNLCSSLVLKSAIFENGKYQHFLLGILPKDQELEKVIWPNIALSTRTGPHTLYNVDYKGAIFQKSFSGNNF